MGGESEFSTLVFGFDLMGFKIFAKNTNLPSNQWVEIEDRAPNIGPIFRRNPANVKFKRRKK